MTKWMKSIRVASAIALAASGTAALAQTTDQGDAELGQEQEGWMQDEQYPSESTMESDQLPVQPQTNIDVDVNQGTGGSGAVEPTDTQSMKDERRRYLASSSARNMPVSLKVGGGIEGQGQDLGDALAPGPLWTAAIGVQPFSFMGLELGYSGSTHELDTKLTGSDNDGAVNGADFVRNGGHVVATVGLPTPVVQPYAVGGVGIDRYDFRGTETATSFQDDTAGRAPIGGGLRTAVGNFTADARATYNVLFEQEFAPQIPNNQANTYDVSLNIGARF